MNEIEANPHILEPYFQAFEKATSCRITLHDYANCLFAEGQPLFNHAIRCSHRRTFPEQCGKELRQYCISYCMDNFNARIARTQRDCYFKHCRKGYWEVAAPVYRNHSCILVVFAGIFEPRGEREKMRHISLLLPLFVNGICGIAEKIRGQEIYGNSLKKRIYSYIKENFNRPVSTRDIASHLSLSVPRVCHLIKLHCGKTFFELLTAERIRNAKLFLKKSDFRIKEISSLCGFCSQEHFNRVFLAEVGMTPGKFRLTPPA